MIEDYLKSRQGETLTVVDSAKAAVEALDAAGGQIDGLWRRAQLAQTDETDRRNLIERLNQTLGALSREVWLAHTAACTVLAAMAQLGEVESDLANALDSTAAAKSSLLGQLQDAAVQINTLKAQLATAQPAAADTLVVAASR